MILKATLSHTVFWGTMMTFRMRPSNEAIYWLVTIKAIKSHISQSHIITS